jgi:predicted dehydrogenase
MASTRGKVRYAVVGLGHIAQAAVLPAFAHATRNSELGALVSDDPIKLKKLGHKYGVPGARYADFEDLLVSEEIDAVYIALPNNLHREYTLRAASVGAHVLCEKPMAVTEKECVDMIAACRDASVKLMIAYRLHFEAANLQAMEIAESGQIGEARLFNSVFTMNVKEGNVRLKRSLGGGTLYDIGVYCINAARYLFLSEPVEVSAVSVSGREARFREVDEMTAAVLRFPGDRLATFVTSFGAASVGQYQIVGTEGDLRVDPAYAYAGELKHTLTGKSGKPRVKTFPKRDQFAPELLYFSECIMDGRSPEPSGEEGLADVRIVEALYRSADLGRPVAVEPVKRAKRPSLKQEIRRPPVRQPKPVRVSSPKKEK